jgi:hypothetical protein
LISHEYESIARSRQNKSALTGDRPMVTRSEDRAVIVSFVISPAHQSLSDGMQKNI